MALTFNTRKPGRDEYTAGGGKKVRITTITFDNSYPNPGGWAVTNRQLGLNTGEDIIKVILENASNGYPLVFDYTNSKIKTFSAPGTELVNASAALNNATAVAMVIAR